MMSTSIAVSAIDEYLAGVPERVLRTGEQVARLSQISAGARAQDDAFISTDDVESFTMRRQWMFRRSERFNAAIFDVFYRGLTCVPTDRADSLQLRLPLLEKRSMRRTANYAYVI
jgi:hypothetical protein